LTNYQRSSFLPATPSSGSEMENQTTENVSRRCVTIGSASLLLSGLSPVLAHAKAESAPYASSEDADKWMTDWMTALKAASGFLHMGRFLDRIYFLDKEITWKPEPPNTGPTVSVPRGFVTDLASIPRIFWSMLPPDGQYTYPAVIHDFMYWTQQHPRDVADKVFYDGMRYMKVEKSKADLIYAAVRVGGGSPWENNAKLRDKGERRLIRTFPQDPRTTWTEWQKRADCCAFI
jgi:hypothetical protein